MAEILIYGTPLVIFGSASILVLIKGKRQGAALGIAVLGILMTIALMCFHPVKCPECGEWNKPSTPVHCQDCGYGACPQCEQVFGFNDNRIPEHCPECGTEVKE